MRIQHIFTFAGVRLDGVGSLAYLLLIFSVKRMVYTVGAKNVSSSA
jgi:hypothetical protein